MENGGRMNQLIEFPQRQHIEFRRLVFRSVLEAARTEGIGPEEYISRIYTAGENPELFATQTGLNSVYRRFRVLIENSLLEDRESDGLPDTNKAYLCFRIYLHNTCCEHQRIPESEAELYLLDALQEYFSANNRILSANMELRILRYLKGLRRAAAFLPA